MKFVVVISQDNIKTAMCFNTHDDAVDYINECIHCGDTHIRSVREIGEDVYQIAVSDKLLFRVEILTFDDGDVRFDLEQAGIKGNETRRFSRRDLAINFFNKVLDEQYDCYVDPGENENGEWIINDENKNTVGVAKLWLVILSENRNHDDYSILGLKTTADEAEVKAAYRKLSFKTHPDRGGNAAEFERIHEAYQRIMDGHGRKSSRQVLQKFQCSDMRYFFEGLAKEITKAKAANEAQLRFLYGQVRAEASTLVARGIVEILIGGILTGISFGIAPSTGGYVVFIGLLMAGCWNLLKGIFYYLHPKAALTRTSAR